MKTMPLAFGLRYNIHTAMFSIIQVKQLVNYCQTWRTNFWCPSTGIISWCLLNCSLMYWCFFVLIKITDIYAKCVIRNIFLHSLILLHLLFLHSQVLLLFSFSSSCRISSMSKKLAHQIDLGEFHIWDLRNSHLFPFRYAMRIRLLTVKLVSFFQQFPFEPHL